MRIEQPSAVRAAATGQEQVKYYLDRLLKMIPAEVISLYLIGQGVVPTENMIAGFVWAAVCLIGVVALRAWGTADQRANKPTDWVHVIISSVAFVIWVYTLGGPFAQAGIQLPWLGSLVVLAWTFFVPFFYPRP
jgi:hypothetical protein